MVEVVCGVRMGLGVGGVGNRGEGVLSSGGNDILEELGGGIVAGYPMGFSESCGKTPI